MGIRYPVEVEKTLLNSSLVREKGSEDFYNIHRGILFHGHSMFIFSPISHSDIVNNLMQVIYKETEIHPSIMHLKNESDKRERQKLLKKILNSIANDLSNQNPMESSNSPHYLLDKYDFIEENFSSTETYATFKLKFDTMRMMVYYEMPVQRKRAPGKNCDWIRHLSHTENHIIRDPRFQVCRESWDKYLQNFLQQKEINQGPKDTTETSKSSKEWKEQISDKATTSPSEKSPFQVYIPPPVQTNKTQGQIPTPTSETDDGSRKKQNLSDNIQAQTVGQVGLKNNSLTLQQTDRSHNTEKNNIPERTRKSKSILSNNDGIKAKSIQESKTDTIAGSNVLEEYSLATPKPIEDSKICEDIFGTNTEHDEDDSESLFSSGSSLLQIEVEKEDMEL